MPGETENGFDLLRLTMAVDEVHRALEDQYLDVQGRETLRIWWEERSRMVGRYLKEMLAQTTKLSLKERLFLAMGVYILLPDDSLGPGALNDDLPEYIKSMRDQLAREQADKIGQVRPRRSDKPRSVLSEQIEDLENMMRDVRSVLYSVQEAMRMVRSGRDGTHDKAERFCEELLEQVQKPLHGLLEEFYDLRDVVEFVHNLLPVVYLENRAVQWRVIDQRLTGDRDLAAGKPWIPQGLKTHVSLVWVGEAKNRLRVHRENLERFLDEIARAIEYERLEAQDAVSSPSPGASLSGAEEQAWAQAFVAAERSQAQSPLEEQSLVEHAAERYEYVRTHAVLNEYIEYTRDAEAGLLSQLSKRLLDHPKVGTNQQLGDYLQECSDALSNLRHQLLPILGGRLRHGQKAERYTVWGALLNEAVERARGADFKRADSVLAVHLDMPRADNESGNSSLNTSDVAQIAVDRPQTLAEAISRLGSIMRTNEIISLGMARKLLVEADRYQGQLQEEQDSTKRLRGSLEDLHQRYAKHREAFEANLRYLRKLQRSWRARLPWLFRRHRRSIEDYMHRTLVEFGECLKMCPEDPWVRGWEGRMPPPGPQGFDRLSTRDWHEMYLPNVPQPGSGGSA